MVTHSEIKRFYDRLGNVEDWWSIFGDGAIDNLIAHGAFERAHAICELGCGTGRLGERLLRDYTSNDCRYVGLDLSTTMVRLARRRLEPWADRALVAQADAVPRIPLSNGAFDRFIATYVIEIFGPDEVLAILDEAYRIPNKGGLVCLTSLGEGQTWLSRFVCSTWNRIYGWRPTLVGGCRPIALRNYLPAGKWAVRHQSMTVRWGIPCETVVAERR